ncbi:MAG: hypothetical protein CL677_10505 [Bdellovibrionaceae bacterium]|nr:hypothetical protein [Pseudobdellovibrionaceae bacterium]
MSGGGGSDNPSNEDDDNSKPCDESLTRVYLELRNTIAINRDYSTGIRSRTVLHAALLYELLEKYHVITANQENSQLIVKHYESLFNTTGRLRGEPRFKVCSFERI